MTWQELPKLFKLTGAAIPHELGSDILRDAIHQRGSPGSFKQLLGSGLVGKRGTVSLFGVAQIHGNRAVAPSALSGVTPIGLICQKSLHRCEKKRAEPA